MQKGQIGRIVDLKYVEQFLPHGWREDPGIQSIQQRSRAVPCDGCGRERGRALARSLSSFAISICIGPA
jgi:hypothetical protein